MGLFLVAVLTVLGTLGVVLPRHGVGQSPPCATSADTAATLTGAVKQIVTVGDSARLATLGLPYRPASGVTLISDANTCTTAIAAVNARFATVSPADSVQRAYVFRVGTTVYAVVPPPTAAGQLRSFLFLDSGVNFLAQVDG